MMDEMGEEEEEVALVDAVVEEVFEQVLLVIELLVLVFDIVTCKLVIILELCGGDVEVCVSEVEVVLVKISLLLRGSRADCDERLNTEPQSIDLVLLVSTSSPSPNAESVSFGLFTELLVDVTNCDTTGDVAGVDGNGVARPDDESLSG